MFYAQNGDVALRLILKGNDSTGAYLKDTSGLWPGANVPWRIETFEWDGIVEPIFLDEQIENITRAVQHIQNVVPCFIFR